MKPNKYKNRKTEVNGITFDSAKEANRYKELLLLQRSGTIRNLRLQPQFTLTEGYKDAETGESVRALRYIADFSYEICDGNSAESPERWKVVVEDVKGKKTKEYNIKKKLMLNNKGIRIHEV